MPRIDQDPTALDGRDPQIVSLRLRCRLVSSTLQAEALNGRSELLYSPSAAILMTRANNPFGRRRMAIDQGDWASRLLYRTATLIVCSFLIPTLILTSGCAGPKTPKEPELSSDGLVMVRRTRRSRLWIKPDHHLGRYDDVLLKRIGFGYGRGQDRLDPDQEAEVGRMLQSVVLAIAQSGPVGMTTNVGPCVVAVNLGLKDLRLHAVDYSDSTASYVSSFGSTTMIIEFRDSITDVALVRYVANRKLGGGTATGKSGVDLRRLGRALGGMVANMNTELQTILPSTTVRSETECHDGIYKASGRG